MEPGAVTENLNLYIAGAYMIVAFLGMWMWRNSGRMLKRAENTLKGLENKNDT